MAARAEGDGFQAGGGEDDAEVTVHAAGEGDDEDYEEAGDYVSENDLDEEDEETTAWAYYCGDWLVVAATWRCGSLLSIPFDCDLCSTTNSIPALDQDVEASCD